ncbi:4-oxalocrotonate tautomerase [Mesorhizobium sp. M00.F.Ca.ET.186.01.1.1]|nr:4-oxalocrotonate tautomerase [bacterium M00.F.Ca.ET.205.01.1.1]TGU50535.1 4-oxalocrotonate tautomerase [bacterium M00.F.Ca.ET.152.01.1.1]TGV33998.1 4-oxalocrotonate tautomerase [Mesorhizobium sp. M00.F.Ca.ET.186.01.1.1]TGZ40899.1 4-oxalocrotonate tautomerase [bacterium M00.F.Ca.ET.162.01.1.1]
MPHVIIKLYAGKSEQQKVRIAEAVTKAIVDSAGSAERSISVGIEDIAPEDWTEKVYKPDIAARMDQLHKKPGYNPL